VKLTAQSSSEVKKIHGAIPPLLNKLPWRGVQLRKCTGYTLIIFGKEYESVSKSFRTGRPELELNVVELSATRFSCITIL
jgi:hypothetical protein